MKKTVLFFYFLLCMLARAAAQTNEPEMADMMRSNGKIYVVVAVCLVILFGLIGYVVYVDRKISKIEQKKD